MNIIVFSTKSYDRDFLTAANRDRGHEMSFIEAKLSQETVVLAKGFDCICAFVNDQLDVPVLQRLAEQGVRLIALRCAGFNNVDLSTAARLGIRVVRVPAYSPHAVAEHGVGLVLMLNRNLHRAYSRVRDGNFALGGLLGFDLHRHTVGIVGTGQIGRVFAQIMRGFGCRLIAFDKIHHPDCEELGLEYVDLPRLFSESDIISLHCPLTPETHHMINAQKRSADEKGSDDHQYQPRCGDRYPGLDRRIETRPNRLCWARRLRGRGGCVLRGPFEPSHPRRYPFPLVNLSERGDYWPSSLFHQGRADLHCRNDAGKYHLD